MYLGDTSITNFKVGDSQVDKIYLGTDIVWPDTNYSAIPLTFEILSAGTIVWRREGGTTADSKTIQYKINDGEWTSITAGTGNTASFSVVAGDKVQFKGNNRTYYPMSVSNRFLGTAAFNAYGNILSLIYGDNYTGRTEFPTGATTNVNSNFRQFFYNNTKIIDASNIVLASNVKQESYYSMFKGCTNLEKAPTLPATTLVTDCYKYMFDGCYKINYIKCLATNVTSNTYTNSWLNGVSSTGTFVKAASASSWPSGRDGIPSNWAIENA